MYKGPGSCKTSEDIKQYMANNLFYFISQKKVADKDLYRDAADDSFIENGKYFPL